MKIENDKQTGLLDSLVKSTQSKLQKEPATEKKGNQGAFDKVELSSGKQEISELKERVKAEPAARQDKVDAMKEAIQNQTYNVKGELVAKSMLKSQLLDELL
ncbi:MAG TPA: flagellar biosynthesis anti-sigma factor FlgM [Syntrophorhabdaceae bacterium]|nr:flagellar biosynthesis anti-sigma factor FlgM [Syntrophorhabdaceae bacterium]